MFGRVLMPLFLFSCHEVFGRAMTRLTDIFSASVPYCRVMWVLSAAWRSGTGRMQLCSLRMNLI